MQNVQSTDTEHMPEEISHCVPTRKELAAFYHMK